MVTAKDLELAAQVLREADYLTEHQRGLLANELATAFKISNPRVDRERFIRRATTTEG